jgi:hypothetical protein
MLVMLVATAPLVAIFVGYAIAALGYVACAGVVTAAGASLTGWELAPALLIADIGSGMATTPLIGTILSGVNPREAGGVPRE